MSLFNLVSEYAPGGDQPEAIAALVKGLRSGTRYQTLQGVTGSGKTFTLANVIAQADRPVLVLSHNKTLAAQLYSEFKSFFPDNAVEYFISYYDYYLPESYIPQTDTYIAKDASINENIERMRLSATASLIERRDVIVVASVSCIYGLGDPEDYEAMSIELKVGASLDRNHFLELLVAIQYLRNDMMPEKGNFRVRDVWIALTGIALMIGFSLLVYYGLVYPGFDKGERETMQIITIVQGNILQYVTHRPLPLAVRVATSAGIGLAVAVTVVLYHAANAKMNAKRREKCAKKGIIFENRQIGVLPFLVKVLKYKGAIRAARIRARRGEYNCERI